MCAFALAGSIMLVISMAHLEVSCIVQEKSNANVQEIESLIEGLVSKNTPIPTNNELLNLKDLSDFSVEKQKLVDTAYQELKKKGVAAFPKLVEFSDDERFSKPVHTGVAWTNRSVGRACVDLIMEQIDLCPPPGKYNRDNLQGNPIIRRTFLIEAYDGKIKKWWSVNQFRSLPEMQLEALNWHLEKEKEIGIPTQKGRYLDYWNSIQSAIDKTNKGEQRGRSSLIERR